MTIDYGRVYKIPAPTFPGTKPCDENPEVFFGPDVEADGDFRETKGEARRREHMARLLCRRCPFLVECALHGLEHEDYGVWGGFAEPDRSAFGGRNPDAASGGRHSPAEAMARLSKGGLPEHAVRTILRRWKRKQRRGRSDDEYGEVA